MQCYRGISFRKELAVELELELKQKIAKNYLLANDAKKSPAKYLNSKEIQTYFLEKRINCALCILGNKDLTQAVLSNIDNIIIILEHTKISFSLSIYNYFIIKVLTYSFL